MKKILIALTALFGWISCVSAENFYIENYDVILNADNYNNINIEENIDVNFTSSSHGIYREIPLVNKVTRSDGKSYKTYAKISNVRTSEQNSISRDDGNFVIKLGDPDKYVNGEKSYSLKYQYSLEGADDEFYFNIIGDSWDTDIKKVTFKIVLPKKFPYDNVGLSIGQYGTQGFTEGASFKTDDINNTIEGYTTRELKPHEALTVRVQLPKGYFIKKYNPIRPLCYFLITLFTLISFTYWFIFGKDKKAIPVVNFYPPKDFNSALVGLIYTEKAEIEQVVSLIIYLADKGYLRIEDDGISQTLYKLKDYDGENIECIELMSALFKYGRNTVSTIELETSTQFYKDCRQILSHLDIAKNVIYEKDSIKLSTKLPIILSIGVLLLILFASLLDFSFYIDAIIPLFVALMFAFSSFNLIAEAFSKGGSFFSKIPVLIIVILLCAPMLSLMFLYGNSSFYRDIIITSFIALIACAVCLYQLPKKNNQGLAILGHILGYKKFLETAQKDELEKLANDNPKYYFNMIPYAYVLGVSEVWIEKFKNIANSKPDWYSGDFSSRAFRNFTDNFRSISTPSEKNGGISTSSSGGGGFSGGGSGGGGGGSW